MKKKCFLLFIILMCSGCFFNKTQTLTCDLSTNVGDVTIESSYIFTYKKDKIDHLSLKMTIHGDNDQRNKIYQKYTDEYKKLLAGNSTLDVNFDDKDKMINLQFDVDKNSDKVLNHLNLLFIKDTSFEYLKKDLSNTEYRCR